MEITQTQEQYVLYGIKTQNQKKIDETYKQERQKPILQAAHKS